MLKKSKMSNLYQKRRHTILPDVLPQITSPCFVEDRWNSHGLPRVLAVHMVSFLPLTTFLCVRGVNKYWNKVTYVDAALPHTVDTRDWKTIRTDEDERLPRVFFSMLPVTLYVGGTLHRSDIGRLCGRKPDASSLRSPPPRGTRTTRLHLDIGNAAMKWNVHKVTAIDALAVTYPYVTHLTVANTSQYSGNALGIDGVFKFVHLVRLEVDGTVGDGRPMHLPPTLHYIRMKLCQQDMCMDTYVSLPCLTTLHIQRSIGYRSLHFILHNLLRLHTLRFASLQSPSFDDHRIEKPSDVFSSSSPSSSSTLTSLTIDRIENVSIASAILAWMPALQHCSLGKVHDLSPQLWYMHHERQNVDLRFLELHFDAHLTNADRLQDTIASVANLTHLTRLDCLVPVNIATYAGKIGEPGSLPNLPLFQPLTKLVGLSHLSLVYSDDPRFWIPPGLVGLQRLTICSPLDKYVKIHYPNLIIDQKPYVGHHH